MVIDRPRVLVFAGSIRKGSFNRRLAMLGARLAREAGAQVTYLDLADYPMPIFDQDLEASGGRPEAADRLRAAWLDHDGVLIASPEYNGSLAPLLKNAIDWVSRAVPGDDRSPYADRIVGLMSASTGGLGGTRALPQLRLVMSQLGALVLPRQVGVPRADAVFPLDDGRTSEPRIERQVADLVGDLIRTVRRMRGGCVQGEAAT